MSSALWLPPPPACVPNALLAQEGVSHALSGRYRKVPRKNRRRLGGTPRRTTRTAFGDSPHSFIIAEDDGLFYMMHGDVTYCDAALKANKLSIIFEDKAAARDTLDRVRAFIKARPTVYLSTHCPEGYESLALKRVMKLA